MFLTWNFLSEDAELKLSLLIGFTAFTPWVSNDQSGFLELRECTHYEKSKKNIDHQMEYTYQINCTRAVNKPKNAEMYQMNAMEMYYDSK